MAGIGRFGNFRDSPPFSLGPLKQFAEIQANLTPGASGGIFWSHEDTFSALTDGEEMQLVSELAGPNKPVDVVAYTFDGDTRRKYERLMFAHLKRTLLNDPEGFNRRYQYRTMYLQDAVDLFKLYIDAYERFTRNAMLGRWREADVLEGMGERISQLATGEHEEFVVTITNYSRWRRRFRAIGEISFPVHSIQSLAGTPTSFVLITDTMNIKFDPRFVRVTVVDNSDRRADFQEDDDEQEQ